MEDIVIVEVRDNIAYVNINRPKQLNALNNELLDTLYDNMKKLDSDNSVKVIVITGIGKAFVAGADIESMVNMEPAEGELIARKGHRLMNYIENIKKPVIAAINGFALGGGCELGLACDFRIASENAKFGQPEINLGILPGFGGSQRLPKLIGISKAKMLIMTGDIIDAKKAYEIGLVDEILEDDKLMEYVEKLAIKLASKSSKTMNIIKETMNKTFQGNLEEGLKLEISKFKQSFSFEDKKEGMKAFLEKRKPDFKDR